MAIRKLAEGLPEGTYTCNSKGIDKDTLCIAHQEEFVLIEGLAASAKPSLKPST